MKSGKAIKLLSFTIFALLVLSSRSAAQTTCDSGAYKSCLANLNKIIAKCKAKALPDCDSQIGGAVDDCGGIDFEPCAGGESCVRGRCVCQGMTCGSSCVNLITDAANCGACGRACPANNACQNSACVSVLGQQGYQCLPGNTCNTGLTCTSAGICDALGTQGKACSPLGACAAGLTCNASHTCDALGTQGQTCSPLGACVAGLTCNGSHICDALGTQGQACSPLSACAAGLSCTSGNICDALGTQGQSCSPLGACTAGLMCNANKICDALGAKAGAACSPLGGCVAGLTCNGNNTCQPVPVPPYPIQGLTVVDDAYDGTEGWAVADHVSLAYAPPVSTKRFVASPQGSVQFNFPVGLNDGPVQAFYTIKAIACGPLVPANACDPNQIPCGLPNVPANACNQYALTQCDPKAPGLPCNPYANLLNGVTEISAGMGSITLYGSAVRNAPASLQAPPGGTAWGEIQIPLNVDWAASTVRFQVTTGQYDGMGNNLTYGCGTQQDQENGTNNCPANTLIVLPYPGGSTTPTGMDLSAVNPNLTLVGAVPNDAFALFLTPALRFQLPVLPVAIVYAPLGNGAKAQSQYIVTVATGSSLQVGINGSVTNAETSDDKTNYGENFSFGLGNKSGNGNGNNKSGDSGSSNPNASSISGQLGMSFGASQAWDNAVEMDYQDSYGQTGSVAWSNSTQTTYPISPASNEPALNKLDPSTLPFWNDEFVMVVNPQFAVWDYPGGLIEQPLGSLQTVGVTVKQLDTCSTTPGAAQTSTPNDSNAAHMILVGGPPSNPLKGSYYIWLSSPDCAQILSLDPFYAQKTQSPDLTNWSYRQIQSASVPSRTGQSWDQKQGSLLTAGTTQSSQFTTKLTAISENADSAAMTGSVILNTLNIGAGVSAGADGKLTGVTTTQVTYNMTSSKTLQEQTEVSTMVQDMSGCTVGVNVLQDTIFQGIAVQQTGLECQPTQRRVGLHTAVSLPAQPHVSPPSLPVVEWNAPGPRPQAYIEHSPWGSVIVQNRKLTTAEVDTQIQKLRAAAAKRHFARPVPPAPSSKAIAGVKAKEVLPVLKAIKNPSPAVQKAVKSLEQKQAH